MNQIPQPIKDYLEGLGWMCALVVAPGCALGLLIHIARHL